MSSLGNADDPFTSNKLPFGEYLAAKELVVISDYVKLSLK